MSVRTRDRACPQRTCVGCRQRTDKRSLLRVVVNGGSLIPDLRGRLPGRGAYVHPVPACLEQAARRRAFNRAFRGPGPYDLAALREHVERIAQTAP
ncbi:MULTISPECIES: YlxR family protein [Streptomyces]|uniref:DNA-binding protein n=1 Tax=Streptomyces cacaoi TaxID=1898 RepID=A0A4Y3R4K1_STRCI|nr:MULTISPECIES: YlxR family protein [Streptomyces]NNG87947.1 YlxR family protein [Streptomyces cacaoi]QHF96683.1 DUF448 domain-containing protein [Streptomyces sp. NHF165]GEB51683.1 DNA-binding protein [Streptomyces cacaoi]